MMYVVCDVCIIDGYGGGYICVWMRHQKRVWLTYLCGCWFFCTAVAVAVAVVAVVGTYFARLFLQVRCPAPLLAHECHIIRPALPFAGFPKPLITAHNPVIPVLRGHSNIYHLLLSHIVAQLLKPLRGDVHDLFFRHHTSTRRPCRQVDDDLMRQAIQHVLRQQEMVVLAALILCSKLDVIHQVLRVE